MIRRHKSKIFLMAGGLGNQLFILAAGTYYSIRNNESVVFDRSNYACGLPHLGSDIRSLNPDVVFQDRPYRFILNYGLKRISHRALFSGYTSPGIGYDPALEGQISEKQIFGYFQTYKYLEDLRVKKLIDSMHLGHISDWFEKSTSAMQDFPTISVHIRRGDYKNLLDSFGVLSIGYYTSAINYILENSSTSYARVLVFSDEIEVARQIFSQLKVSLPVQFAESPDNNPEETLMLMSQSHGLVMSNSSFSWWAAQIGNKSKFIVCPSKWFRGMLDPEELFPPEWHRWESQWEV